MDLKLSWWNDPENMVFRMNTTHKEKEIKIRDDFFDAQHNSFLFPFELFEVRETKAPKKQFYLKTKKIILYQMILQWKLI